MRRSTAVLVAICVVTALATLVFASGWVGVIRDTLHWGCSYLSDGEYAGWVCADGIGYIMPGLFALGLEAVAGVTGVVLIASRGSGSRRALRALGAAPVLVLVAVWAAAAPPAPTVFPPEFLVATALLGLGGVLSLGAAALPARVARVLLPVAASCALAALVVRVDLASPAVLGAGIGAAALVADAGRTPRRADYPNLPET